MTVRRWVAAGLLKPAFVTAGGHLRFDEADLEVFAASRRKAVA